MIRGRGEHSSEHSDNSSLHLMGMSKLAVPVSAKDHVEGSDKASVTLVEYGDYQCPSCGEAYPIVKKLQKHFGERLRFVFRNFPLEMHPWAEHAAEAAEFAAAKGKFWEMHDALFSHQTRLADSSLLRLAEGIGLKGEELGKALEAGTYSAKVKADFAGGVKSGVTGTPMFYLNGQRYDDSYDYETLAAAIEALL